MLGSPAKYIANRIYFSTILAIESWISEYENYSGKSLELLLTGGDANAVSSRLNRFYTVEPNLVLGGFLYVLRRN